MNYSIMSLTFHFTGEVIVLEHEFRRLGRSITHATHHAMLRTLGSRREARLQA